MIINVLWIGAIGIVVVWLAIQLTRGRIREKNPGAWKKRWDSSRPPLKTVSGIVVRFSRP